MNLSIAGITSDLKLTHMSFTDMWLWSDGQMGPLGLFIFLMMNRDITYVPNKKFGRCDLEYAR